MSKRMNSTITSLVCAGALAALLTAGISGAQRATEAETLLQTAHKKEVVDGDLPGAIEIYKKALAAANGNRSIAAMALVRMADLYRRNGDNQSRKIYEQVVKDYPEQREAVSLAKAALGENAAPAGMNSKLVWKFEDSLSDVYPVSPDGRYLTFAHVDSRDGRQLLIHDLSTGLDRRIDESLPGDAAFKNVYSSDFLISKDGNQVVFTWRIVEGSGLFLSNKNVELRRASVTGNAKTERLYEFPSDITGAFSLDWTSDGRTVAVLVLRKGGTRELGLVSIANRSYQPLKSLEWRPSHFAFFSPDGRWLAFDDQEPAGTNKDVFILAVDGSREIPAVNHRANDELIGWSPDGKWFLFSSDRNGATELWGAPFDGGAVGSPRLLKSSFENVYPLGVTRSGTLYYEQENASGASKIGLASIDINTGRIAPIEFPQNTLHNNVNPQWSPNGKNLAYISKRADGNVLVIRSMESGQPRELRPDVLIQQLYGWSPAGNWLAVTARDSSGRYGIHLVDPETGQVKPLAPTAGGGINVEISWAPDGRYLWFTSNSEKIDPGLHRADVATGSISRLLPFPSVPAVPPYRMGVISPDGKRNYRVRGGAGAILELDLSGTEKELKTEIAGRPFSPFAPFVNLDGHLLINGYETVDGLRSRVLRLISTTGGEPRDLMRVPMPAGSRVSPTIYPLRLVSESASVLAAVVTSETSFWLVPLQGGEARKIGNSSDVLPTNRDGLSLSPDGRHLAYTVGTTLSDILDSRPTREIWALENFLPKTAIK